MLFILNSAGVPSNAKFIRLGLDMANQAGWQVKTFDPVH